MSKLQEAIVVILKEQPMTEDALIQSLIEYGCFQVIDPEAFRLAVKKQVATLGLQGKVCDCGCT